MSSALKIAITADPYIPVPPTAYGGIERVVAGLVTGLTARGHQVTLFAHPESRVTSRHVAYGVPPHESVGARARELWQVGGTLWRMRHHLDIVHSFGRLAALVPLLPNRRVAKIQTYQRQVPWRGVARATLLAGSSITFTACSSAQWQQQAGATHGHWRTIYNGVDLDLYRPSASVAADAPLVFLGRVERIKGTHTAIDIARRAGRRLVIAGNTVTSPEGSRYFEHEIRPHLDPPHVTYVGPVGDVEKNRVLGSAAALLMPIEWEEPFGIVMIEAMACGTPVIGFRRGSVPEVIDEGVSGFVVGTTSDAVAAVEKLGTIDRSAVRARCAERFAFKVMVDAYEALYHEALTRTGELPRTG